MQKEIDNELYNYLTEIFNQLYEEKSSSTNIIDTYIINKILNNKFSKYCLSCNKKNIENKKQTCPDCKTKLLTLEELQKQNIFEEINIPDNFTKEFNYKFYNIENESIVPSTSRISITQQPIADLGVKVPDIYVPDPLNINPNSIANIEKILLHIEKITGIKEKIRKWIPVICDGVPYRHAIKLKEKFPWLILIPGPLHEKMNMLKAYVKLNWKVNLKQFAICQGYRTESQLEYFKKCHDHHKSWDSICNIYRQAISLELIWPYIKNHNNPTIKDYLI